MRSNLSPEASNAVFEAEVARKIAQVERQAREAVVAQYKSKLSSDRRWARRALVVLFERQTPREQEGEHTEELNRMGFSKFDAEILSSFAKQVKRGRTLSPKQLAVAYRRLPKYAGQLYQVASGDA